MLECQSHSFESKEGDTPLHLAVNNNQIDIFWVLVRAGADITMTNQEGHVPIHMQATHKNLAMELWQLRNTLPCKAQIADACFEILAPAFIIKLTEHFSDMLELLKGTSAEKINPFLKKHLYARHHTPLFCVAKLTEEKEEYLSIGKLMLDHAESYMLTEENGSGQNFLSCAILRNHYALIDYARTCQHGKFKDLVNNSFPANFHHPQSASQTIIPEQYLPALPQQKIENKPAHEDGKKSLQNELDGLKRGLKQTHHNIEQSKNNIEHYQNEIERLKKAIAYSNHTIATLTYNIPQQEESIKECEGRLKEFDKQALLKELDDNFQTLEAVQQRQSAIQTQLQAMGCTTRMYLPLSGNKRPLEEDHMANAPPSATPSQKQ